jgi:ParB/RepB/Spo0J family partition protein
VPTVVTEPVEKPRDFFFPDPTNPRKDIPEAELRELGESMLRHGQIVPGIAWENGMMIDMHRRKLAAELVGKPTLTAYLMPLTTSEAVVKTIQLTVNLQRADLKPYEVYLGFKSWMELHPGATAKELADAVSRSEATVSMTMSLDKCIPAVREAAAQGKIGLKDWHAIRRVSAEEQPALLAAKLGRASAGELKRLRKKPSDAVKVARVKCELGSGVVVTLAGVGEGLTLENVIETLSELLKEAKKANDQGLDSKTFSLALKCRKGVNHVRVG